MSIITEQEILTDEWHGLYGESWKGLIRDEAFAHLRNPSGREIARSSAKTSQFRFVAVKHVAAVLACLTYLAAVNCRHEISAAELVKEKFRDIGPAYFHHSGNGSGRNSEIPISPRLGVYLKAKMQFQPLGQNAILVLAKLFCCYLYSGFVPRSIIADQTRERDRVLHAREHEVTNNLPPVSIEQLSIFAETWSRNCVKASAAPRLAVAFINVRALLNWSRVRCEPRMFLSQPRDLLFRVVARKMEVAPVFLRPAKRGIAEQCSQNNLLLKGTQRSVAVLNVADNHA